MARALYGFPPGEVAPGVVITNVDSEFGKDGTMHTVRVKLAVDPTQADVAIGHLIAVMNGGHMPTTTTTALPSYPDKVTVDDYVEEEMNGTVAELRKLIEERFDDVDQALRLLVDP